MTSYVTQGKKNIVYVVIFVVVWASLSIVKQTSIDFLVAFSLVQLLLVQILL